MNALDNLTSKRNFICDMKKSKGRKCIYEKSSGVSVWSLGKTSMLWPSQNFLLYKSTILIKYFTSMFLRLHAIEAEIQLSRVFQKKKEY